MGFFLVLHLKGLPAKCTFCGVPRSRPSSDVRHKKSTSNIVFGVLSRIKNTLKNRYYVYNILLFCDFSCKILTYYNRRVYIKYIVYYIRCTFSFGFSGEKYAEKGGFSPLGGGHEKEVVFHHRAGVRKFPGMFLAVGKARNVPRLSFCRSVF